MFIYFKTENDKKSYKESIIRCLKNIEDHIDDTVLNDFDANSPLSIDIHIKINPREVAVYNVKKEYLSREEK